MTVVMLIGTATLGLVMAAYLLNLMRQRRFVLACSFLAAAFAFIALSATLLSLHLVYDVPTLLPLRALLALLSIPCLYLYFMAISLDGDRLNGDRLGRRHLIHLLPVICGIVVLTGNATWLMDFVLFATYLAYLCALLIIYRQRRTRFARLGNYAPQTILWLQIVSLSLALTLILDFIILAEIANGTALKESAPLSLSIVSIAALVSFALIGALGRPSLFEHIYNFTSEIGLSKHPQFEPPTEAQKALADQITRLLQQPAILSDENLTITRLARRLGVPVRKASQAINSVAKCSFSDLLNDRRIEFSKRLMTRNPDKALLEIMLDAGYATKSNFYTQFSKRTGITPAAYRDELKAKTQGE